MREIPEEEVVVEKKPNTKKKLLIIFIATFIIVFILIIQIASWLTPSVDVEIGSETDNDSEQAQQDDNTKKMIDERLKWIQFEDNTVETEGEHIDGINEQENVANSDEYTAQESQKQEKNAPQVNPKKFINTDETVPAEPEVVKAKMNKVYIGDYATVEEAMDVQSKLMDIDLGATPYINGKDGRFFIQVGAFTNIERAQVLVRQLKQYGYSAKIVQE